MDIHIHPNKTQARAYILHLHLHRHTTQRTHTFELPLEKMGSSSASAGAGRGGRHVRWGRFGIMMIYFVDRTSAFVFSPWYDCMFLVTIRDCCADFFSRKINSPFPRGGGAVYCWTFLPDCIYLDLWITETLAILWFVFCLLCSSTGVVAQGDGMTRRWFVCVHVRSLRIRSERRVRREVAGCQG